MIAVILGISFLGILLIAPGWFWFRRNHSQTAWLLVLPIFGAGLWLTLAVLGIGPQSLSNVVEMFFIVAAAVLVTYIKFLVLDRIRVKKYGPWLAYAAIGVVTIIIRLYMPDIPE
jgi:hypothetical protein